MTAAGSSAGRRPRRFGAARWPQLVLVAGILLVVFVGPFAKRQELREKNRRLQQRTAQLAAEIKALEEQRRRLETDITYIERRAREKTGAVRKGEIVIKEAPAPAR